MRERILKANHTPSHTSFVISKDYLITVFATWIQMHLRHCCTCSQRVTVTTSNSLNCHYFQQHFWGNKVFIKGHFPCTAHSTVVYSPAASQTVYRWRACMVINPISRQVKTCLSCWMAHTVKSTVHFSQQTDAGINLPAVFSAGSEYVLQGKRSLSWVGMLWFSSKISF